MTNETKTEDTKAPVPHMLTILVDLSHTNFAKRGIIARVALSEVLSGLARSALKGADATIVQDTNGVPVAVYSINPDLNGDGKEAFKLCVDNINGPDYRQVGEEIAEVRSTAEH